MTDRSIRALALACIAAAWALALWRLGGPEADLSRDDLTWLGSLVDFQRGFEVRKDYGEHGWGLLHWLGHTVGTGAWAEGRVGAGLARLATAAVPLFAVLAWLIARPLSDVRTAWLAAAIAAGSPAALLGASTLGFGVRAGATGLGMLAGLQLLAATAGGAEGDGVRRWIWPLAGALWLQTTGLLLHPWAVVGPLLVAPAALHRAGRPAALGVGLGVVALLAWSLVLLGGDQGHRAGALGSERILAAPWLVASAFAHQAWQWPSLGGWLPAAPGLLAPLLGALGAAALTAWPATRTVGLLLLGAGVAALPELAALYVPRGWDVLWTGNGIKATAGAELAACVGLAAVASAALSRLPRSWALALAVAAVLGVGARGDRLLVTKAELIQADARFGRLLGTRLLAGAAAQGLRAGLLGNVSGLAPASFATRFNPELPPSRRPARRVPETSAAQAGLDWALWQTSTVRCELWLGLGPGDRIRGDHRGHPMTQCDLQPEVLSSHGTHPCSLRSLDGAPMVACVPPPPSAPPRATTDPAAGPHAARLALLLLGCFGVFRPRF